MTLVGLLPPLCDNGNMLVDGGYSKNLVLPTNWPAHSYISIVDNLTVHERLYIGRAY